jgi:LacI family transcriptional regulator
MARTKPTLADVAKAAGVSLATVDRVINQRGNIRPETEQRVFEVARQLGFGNTLSQVPVKLLRFNIVMILSSAAYYQKLKNSIRRARIIFRDLNVSITSHLFRLDETDEAIATLRRSASSCHGVIYAGPEAPNIVAAMDSLPPSCPLVTFATDLPSSRRIAYFGPDNHAAGRLAGDLLGRFSRGQAGSVLLLIGTRLYAGHRQRELGFRSVLAERFSHLTVVPPFETLEDPDRATGFVASSLKKSNRVVGIYNTSNGNRAISDLLAATNRTDIIFINHELTERTRDHLLHGVVDMVIDHNTDNDLQNVLEYLLYFNRRISSDQVLRRENLNVYFRETAGQAAPVV